MNRRFSAVLMQRFSRVQGSHSFTDRTFQDPMRNFPGPVGSPKYKENRHYNVQSVVHWGKFNMKQNLDISSPQNSDELTYIGCWVLHYCCFFSYSEPLEKCTTLRIFFQDWQGPGIFNKNIQDFAGGVWTLYSWRGLELVSCGTRVMV